MKKLITIIFLCSLLSCKKETNMKLNISVQSDKQTELSISYDVFGKKQTVLSNWQTPLNIALEVPNNSKYSVKVVVLKGSIYYGSVYWVDQYKNQKGRSFYVHDGSETKLSGRID